MDFNLLRDREKGKDIYVIASGKSMDFIPDSFFDGKVTIGVCDVYKRYKCTYTVRKENIGAREVFATEGIHIISKHDCGNFSGKIADFPGYDYYTFPHLSNDTTLHLDELDTDRIIVSWSTITSAIHVAYALGAKNIILCGADCGQIDGQNNYDHYLDGIPVPNQDWYTQWLGKITQATEELAQELRKRGIGVMSINPWVNYQMEGHDYSAFRYATV
jgi:hypothetical protein